MLTLLPESVGQLMAQREVEISSTMLTPRPESFGQLMAQHESERGNHIGRCFQSPLASSWHCVGVAQQQDADHVPESFGQLMAQHEVALSSQILTPMPES